MLRRPSIMPGNAFSYGLLKIEHLFQNACIVRGATITPQGAVLEHKPGTESGFSFPKHRIKEFYRIAMQALDDGKYILAGGTRQGLELFQIFDDTPEQRLLLACEESASAALPPSRSHRPQINVSA